MPNTVFRAHREALRLSQEGMAAKIRAAGDELGEPNSCSSKTIHRWENGSVSKPQLAMIRAIERATGQPIEQLGFDFIPKVGRLSDHTDSPTVRVADDARAEPPTAFELPGTLTGIWVSRCDYRSATRGEDFTDLGHLVVIQSDHDITARSIEGSVTDTSTIIMRLELRGHVVTGTWEMTTGAESYYRGRMFYGAIQMQVDASGGRMAGAWVGFGRDHDINTGPWELILAERGTRNVDAYAQIPQLDTI